MPSCDDGAAGFVPLGGTHAAEPFRPLGTPGDPQAGAEAEVAAPAPDPVADAFEAGRAQGRAEAEAERVTLARDVEAAVGAIRAWRDELRTRYTQTLVELAMAAARKVVGDEIEARPERWSAIVAAGVRDLVDREQVTVRVAPRLAALLRAQAPALLAGDGAGEVVIVEDATLADGACRVEGRTGDVECGIDVQLATIADALGTR
ncbi:MAG TPA: FliH/SctL family protein [Candidatus Eisenbacteria bacterium]|nr:FliH/SctL family protein [Candidatus Eisenbacteria bacterium]